jgi:F-type H+-transporting ATPase subunit delta
MVMLENTLSISKDLKVVLKSPIINKDKKASIIEEIFAEKVNKATLEFLLFVNSKNRENILLDIAKRFNEIRNVVLNRVEAEIVSSINFSDDQKNRLQKQLEEYSQKEIIPKFKTDESLIGGFTIKMNDTVIDASVKQQLKRLRKSLV